jgi:hypothetical protein
MLMDRISNQFGAHNFTFKVFTWIYHTLIVMMAVNAKNAFSAISIENTGKIFLACYFISQVIWLGYGFSVRIFTL